MILFENMNPNLLNVIQTCDQGHIQTFDPHKFEIRKNIQGS